MSCAGGNGSDCEKWRLQLLHQLPPQLQPTAALADQAEADKRVAQALAEKRRAMAVAAEQEFKATVMDNRAKVVSAFRDALARDKTRTQVFDITELGLVEMTRKRTTESLEHRLCVLLRSPLCVLSDLTNLFRDNQ